MAGYKKLLVLLDLSKGSEQVAIAGRDMAALSNAIYRALGVRLNQLPMAPGCILETLWA